MTTINRPSSVRAKIGCRSVDQLPASAEGVLAGRFYRFTYEVEEVLVKNLVERETVDPDPVLDDKPKPDNTPKRERSDHDKDESHTKSADHGAFKDSYRGGKACRLLDDEKIDSISSESDADNSLLIETMQRENEEKMRENVVDSSNWITIRGPGVAGTLTQGIQIVEVTGEVDPGLKISSDYMVQLPSSECVEDIILTPSLAPEAPLRFSKRNASGMQDKVEERAKKLANKKDLEGLQQGDAAGELRSGAEMIRASTMQLMAMCEAAKQPIQGA